MITGLEELVGNAVQDALYHMTPLTVSVSGADQSILLKRGDTTRFVINVGLSGLCNIIVCKAHWHLKHANTSGSGGMSPGNFEKLHSDLRLNLRVF